MSQDNEMCEAPNHPKQPFVRVGTCGIRAATDQEIEAVEVMKQPKFSEVLRSAARGYLAPYQPVTTGFGNSPSFSSFDFERAKCTAAAFDAIADLYETYERAPPQEKEGL